MALAVALAACGESAVAPPIPPPPVAPPPPPPGPIVWPTFRIEGDRFWAGARVDVVMSGTRDRPVRLEMLLLDGARVELIRRNDSTLSGNLPADVRGGLHAPVLLLDGRDTVLDEIGIYGPTWQSGQWFDFSTGALFWVPLRVGGADRVMVPIRQGLVVIAPDGSSAQVLPVAAHRMTAPGATPDPAVWILRPEEHGPLERWRLFPTPQRLATLPMTGEGLGQVYAELGPDVLLSFQDDAGAVLRLQGGAYVPQQQFLLHGFKRVAMSPRGDRVAITGNSGMVDWPGPAPQAGIPVFRVPDGGVAYILSDQVAISSVAFSPDGSELAYTSGREWALGGTVRFRDATTGIVRREITPGGAVRGIGYDRRRPYLYLTTVGGGYQGIAVRVYSTETWREVAVMQTPCVVQCPHELLPLADGFDQLQVVEMSTPRGQFILHAFALPPVP